MEKNKYENGQEFLVYQGTEYEFTDIIKEFEYRMDLKFYRPKHEIDYDDNILFCKASYDDREFEYREPFYNEFNMLYSVSGYNQNELEKARIKYTDYHINTPAEIYKLFNYLYIDFDTDMFKKLHNYHFSTVIYDSKRKQLVMGVTTPDNIYNHLYYGYTKKNHELMIGNTKKILKLFCDDIKEMDNNTYMVNGIIKSFGSQIDIADNKEENQIIDDNIKEKIDDKIDEYLLSDDLKQKIDEAIKARQNILTASLRDEIATMTTILFKDLQIDDKIKETIETSFEKALTEKLGQINLPYINVIKLNDIELGRTNTSFYHEKFKDILSLIQLQEPVMLIGPAGSGKNYCISQIADALNLHMYYTNNASNEFKLTGFIDAGGIYRETEFYKAFKNGGIFFLDEIDASDPQALIVINAALANGYMAFPHETINQHPDFRMVAAANTWGSGSDMQYVGRNALDASTLDRYDNVYFDYDKKLEKALYPNKQVLDFMWSIRDAIQNNKIPHIISTRGIGKVYKKEINGIPVETILRTNIIRNLDQDDLNTILANMKNIDEENKYFKAAKTLKLER